MAYINGDQLNIFPVSNRTAKPYDNWLTEFNLSSIINQLVGNQNGFVITENVSAGAPIEFNIGGYYFRVAQASYIRSAVDGNSNGNFNSPSSFVEFRKEGGYYKAVIRVSTNANNPTLMGSDESNIQAGGRELDLNLFDTSYKVPDSSRLSLIVLQNLTVKGTLAAKASSAYQADQAAYADRASTARDIDDGLLPESTVPELTAVDDGNLARLESVGKAVVNDGNFAQASSLQGTANINDGNVKK